MRILGALGVDRVRRGVVAFDDPDPCGYGGCFAVRCAGEKYEFVRRWFNNDSYDLNIVGGLAQELQIDPVDTLWLIKYFDDHRKPMKRTVNIWLELECSA